MDAYALVALDDIKPIVVFQRDDGLAQTVLNNAVIESRPYLRIRNLLRAAAENCGRMRLCAPLLPFRQSDPAQSAPIPAAPASTVQLWHKFGEYGQVRVLTTRFKRVQFLDAFFSSGNIILKHGDRFLSSFLLIFSGKIVSIWLCAANRGAARMQPISFPSL